MQRPTLIFFLLILFSAPQSFAELAGSSHDFSTENWSAGQLCLPCHNAHNDIIGADGAPLWNRSTPTTRYRIHTQLSLSAIVGQPSGVSKLCLSCHDGITAIDGFGGRSGSILISGAARLGNDPSDHHPTSFVFDTALAIDDGDLHDPATTPSGLGGTIAEDLLSDNRVECTSCHDVHNKNGFLLFIDTGGGRDGLCSTCHISGPPRQSTNGSATHSALLQ